MLPPLSSVLHLTSLLTNGLETLWVALEKSKSVLQKSTQTAQMNRSLRCNNDFHLEAMLNHTISDCCNDYPTGMIQKVPLQ